MLTSLFRRQACIKEAMRMHPGVSLPLERIVPLGGTKLCGTYLPAGTVVGVNAAVIHRDRTIFGEDADDFRPERWLKDGQESARRMERYLLTVSSQMSFYALPMPDVSGLPAS